MLADLGCYSLDYIVHVIVEAKCKLRIIKFNVKSLLKSDDELNDEFIMPEAFDPRVAEVVSQAVKSHIR